MSLAAFLAARALRALVVVFAVLVFNFFLLHAAPGDILDTLALEAGGLTDAQRERMRRDWALDQPLHVQLGSHLWQAAQGNLGYSIYHARPVAGVLAEHIAPTLLLVASAVALGALAGSTLGMVSARRPRGWLARGVGVLSMVGLAVPASWLGMLLMFTFAWAWPVFPVGGVSSVVPAATWWGHALDVLHHLVLPAATLGLIYATYYSSLAHAAMSAVLQADYIRTARAKGAGERRVLLRHALRNALLPLVTLPALQFSHAIAGAVVVETLFNWPGLGRLAFESVSRRDAPTLLGVLLAASVAVMLANALADVLLRLVDPRIGFGR